MLAPLALAVDGVPGTLSGANLAGYAYLSLVSAALTYPLWFRGIGQLSAPVTSFLGLLSPLVATTLGVIVLAQTFTLLQSLGFAIVLASILAGQLRSRETTGRGTRAPAGARHAPSRVRASAARHAGARQPVERMRTTADARGARPADCESTRARPGPAADGLAHTAGAPISVPRPHGAR